MRLPLITALPITLALASCSSGDKKQETKSGEAANKSAMPDFRYTATDVTGPNNATPTGPLSVDIYLDGTYSMQGFSRPQPTTFSRLLEGIEAAVQNAAKNSDTRFFKYGRSVAPLTRSEFVASRNNPSLWDDKQFRSETNFAQAVDSTDPGRVSIFITDLFYSNGDAQKVVKAVQDKCFRNGVELGIMALQSDFDGYVADLAPTYKEAVKVTGDRPLYLLICGSKANINLIFSAFRNQPYAQEQHNLLITRYPVKSFSATAAKTRDSKALKNSSERKRLPNSDNTFAFYWDADKGNQGSVDYTITYEQEPYTLPINTANLKASVFRRDQAAKDSVVDTQSLKLLGQQVGTGKLSGKAQVDLKLPEDSYTAYQVIWQYDNLGKVQLPTWVTANSTQDFRQGHDENKTYMLDTFVSNLAISAATQFEPKYGKMYLVFVRK